jgi:hypothetical protein
MTAKRWFTRSELAGADQRASQMQERGHFVGAALVADRQPTVGQPPGQRPLDLPAVTTQPGVGLHSTAGDPCGDASPQQLATAKVVVALIAMELGRSPSRPTRPAPPADDRRDGVHQLLQQLGVVGVGRRQPNRQRDAAGIDQQVVLGSWLTAVDRVCANEVPPTPRPAHSRCRWRPATSQPDRRRRASPAADGAAAPTPRPVASRAAAASRSRRCRSQAPLPAAAARAPRPAGHR